MVTHSCGMTNHHVYVTFLMTSPRQGLQSYLGETKKERRSPIRGIMEPLNNEIPTYALNVHTFNASITVSYLL